LQTCCVPSAVDIPERNFSVRVDGSA